MVKIKLYGIGNDENSNFYIFDKKQKVAEKLSNIIKEIFKVYWGFEKMDQNKKGEWIDKKINIEKNKDSLETISSKSDFFIRVFYGDKKMFMIINCSEKDRLRFNEGLSKIAEMPKVKKSKPNRIFRR